MSRRITLILSALVCLTGVCPAQPAFNIVFGLGPTFVNSTKGLHRFTSPGWGFDLGIAADLGRHAEFSIEGIYKRFDFDAGSVYEIYPHLTDVTGTALQSIEGIARLTVSITKNPTHPFVSLGYGYVYYFGQQISSSDPSQWLARGTYHYEYGFLGGGMQFCVNDAVSVSLGADVCSDEDFIVSIPLLAKLRLGL